MLITVVTLFPDMFPGPLLYSVLGKQLSTLWNLKTINIRDFSDNKWKKVDDTPYGGGAGMVIKPNIIHDALSAALNYYSIPPPIIYMTPRGKVFNQQVAQNLIYKNDIGLIILCGRYEGIDQRVIDFWKEKHNMQEISIGDYVLFGGEIPAMVLIETCLRLIPGIMHNEQSINNESFNLNLSNNTKLLEYPQYTKPYNWNRKLVPDILLSGNHNKIDKWRIQQALKITNEVRPDLLAIDTNKFD